MATTVTVHFLPDYTYAQLLTAGHHAFIADEPEDQGGDDLGPGPYDLLLWALGACTAMTLLMYARRKGWPLEDIAVELSHDRRHVDDCEDCEKDAAGRIEVIERRIALRGQLDDEQRAKLLEIAGRCPVSRTITRKPKIVDSLIAGP